MTKLYTWVFKNEKIDNKTFSLEIPSLLNVDTEIVNGYCFTYDRKGRHISKFRKNKIDFYLAEDFTSEELDNLK